MLHSRDRRVAEAIRQALSTIFQYDIQDPRLPPIVTVTHVDVSKDLGHAKVAYSHMPDDENSRAEMKELLEDSAGFIRTRVAEEVNIKFAPTLSFRYHSSEGNYQRVNEILKQVAPPPEEPESE